MSADRQELPTTICCQSTPGQISLLLITLLLEYCPTQLNLGGSTAYCIFWSINFWTKISVISGMHGKMFWRMTIVSTFRGASGEMCFPKEKSGFRQWAEISLTLRGLYWQCTPWGFNMRQKFVLQPSTDDLLCCLHKRRGEKLCQELLLTWLNIHIKKTVFFPKYFKWRTHLGKRTLPYPNPSHYRMSCIFVTVQKWSFLGYDET